MAKVEMEERKSKKGREREGKEDVRDGRHTSLSFWSMFCWYLAYSATVVTLFELSHFHICLLLPTSQFSSTACFI